MSRDVSGLYTLPAGNPVVTGTTITTTWANTTLTDISSALSDSLSRSGLGGMTAPLRGLDGTVGAPAFSFLSETTLGLYKAGAALLAASAPFQVPAGTEALPSFRFAGSTGLGFYSETANVANLAVGGLKVATVTSAGVFLKVPGPIASGGAYGLDIASDFNFFSLSRSTGTAFNLQAGAASVAMGVAAGFGPLLFYTNGVANERMRLDTSGSLLAGGTSSTNAGRVTSDAMGAFNPPTGADNWKRASFSGRGAFGGGVALVNTSLGSDGYVFYATGNPSNLEVRYGNNGGTVNGAAGVFLTNVATAWASASDERLKYIIEPISGALDKLAALRTVIGRYKSDQADMRRPFLLAQDVQKVLPEAVCRADDFGHLGLAYTDLIPLIIAAINELSTSQQS